MIGAFQSGILTIPASGASGAITPADIPSVRHWVDMLDLSTMWTTEARTTPATLTSPVGSILDKVNGNYYTQTDASSTKRPTAQSAGLSFDGSNDYLGTPKANFDWMKPALTCVRIFVISTPSAVTNNRTMFSIGGYWANGVKLEFDVSKLVGTLGIGNGPTWWLQGSTPNATTAKQLSELHYDPEDTSLREMSVNINNGTPAIRNTNGTSVIGFHASDTLTCIGGVTSGFTTEPVWLFSGTIQEIVITGEMTAGEFADLMTYFQTRHGLSLGV